MSHMPLSNLCHACRKRCVFTFAPGLTSCDPSGRQCPLCGSSLHASPGRDTKFHV